MNTIKYIFFTVLLFINIYAQSSNEYKADCDAGNAESCYELAELYLANNDANNSQEVIMFYKKSCSLGYAKGCTAYGIRYVADKKRDKSKSDIYYFKKACEGGDQAGCNLFQMSKFKQ